jgi:hypothetical protein
MFFVQESTIEMIEQRQHVMTGVFETTLCHYLMIQISGRGFSHQEMFKRLQVLQFLKLFEDFLLFIYECFYYPIHSKLHFFLSTFMGFKQLGSIKMEKTMSMSLN